MSRKFADLDNAVQNTHSSLKEELKQAELNSVTVSEVVNSELSSVNAHLKGMKTTMASSEEFKQLVLQFQNTQSKLEDQVDSANENQAALKEILAEAMCSVELLSIQMNSMKEGLDEVKQVRSIVETSVGTLEEALRETATRSERIEALATTQVYFF